MELGGRLSHNSGWGEDADPEGLMMATAQEIEAIRTGTDARGRAVPMTDEDALLRDREAAKALDALDDMGDAAEQRNTLETLKRGLDRDGDRLSSREETRHPCGSIRSVDALALLRRKWVGR